MEQSLRSTLYSIRTDARSLLTSLLRSRAHLCPLIPKHHSPEAFQPAVSSQFGKRFDSFSGAWSGHTLRISSSVPSYRIRYPAGDKCRPVNCQLRNVVDEQMIELTITEHLHQDWIFGKHSRSRKRIIARCPAGFHHDQSPQVQHGDVQVLADFTCRVGVLFGVLRASSGCSVAFCLVGDESHVLIDRWRSDDDQSRILGFDGRMRKDLDEIARILRDRNALVVPGSGPACIVRTEENGLQSDQNPKSSQKVSRFVAISVP